MKRNEKEMKRNEKKETYCESEFALTFPQTSLASELNTKFATTKYE
jgi:hypothetical protein